MAFTGWDKVTIKTEKGEVEGIAPIIISASRSTDIPAFYSDWFIERLNAGYLKWRNPFNRQFQYVSFEKTRAIVFWTKNAKPLIKYLPLIDSKGINYYFTFTVNDYEEEKLEPNVPKLEERIKTFIELSQLIGKEKVIWRFDPLILSNRLTVEDLLNKIIKIGNQISNYTSKLIISFADISVYSKVQQNLKSRGFINYKEVDIDNMKLIAEKLQEVNKIWKLSINTCGEEVDLSAYGINHNKCIDDDLMIKLFKNDEILINFLGYQPLQQQNLFEFSDNYSKSINPLKDKGQRQACGCIVSKDIGEYNTCMHLCVYCYANHSDKLTKENYFHKRKNNSESILAE